MDPIDRALYNLDHAVERLDKKVAKAAVPKGAVRKIVHRGPDHRITFVDEIPLDQIPEDQR
jgi:hypothetical protein